MTKSWNTALTLDLAFSTINGLVTDILQDVGALYKASEAVILVG